jgi:hypothetical protein
MFRKVVRQRWATHRTTREPGGSFATFYDFDVTRRADSA